MNSKIVQVKGGKVLGGQFTDCKGKKYYSFTKIPYAQCPTGMWRFTESNPELGWSGVFDCSTPVESLCDPPEQDLLFVNVFTPELPSKYMLPAKPKPVMVFIPSGGNYISEHNLSTALYGPEYLVAEDVVVVVVSYRSGALGFMSAPGVDIGGDMGMLDLIAALVWVKDYISAFSGDPRNVTIFAQGTGASVAQHLFVYFETSDLYSKLILQHGGSDWNVVGYYDAIRYARALGLRDVLDSRLAVKFLRALSYEKIVTYEKTLSARGVESFPTLEFDMYRRLNVPLIVGHNKNVHAIYMHDQELLNFLTEKQQTRLDQCKGLVPDPWCDLICEMGEKREKMPISSLEAVVCLCSKTEWSSPVYLYRFNVDGELNIVKKLKKITEPEGAIYGDELGYIFKVPGAPKPKPGSLEERTTRKITQYWTNFAKTGDPNCVEDDGTIWQPVTKNSVSVTLIESKISNKVLYETNHNHSDSV